MVNAYTLVFAGLLLPGGRMAGLPARDEGGAGRVAVESVSASSHGTAFVLMAGVLVLAAVCAASLPRDGAYRELSR